MKLKLWFWRVPLLQGREREEIEQVDTEGREALARAKAKMPTKELDDATLELESILSMTRNGQS